MTKKQSKIPHSTSPLPRLKILLSCLATLLVAVLILVTPMTSVHAASTLFDQPDFTDTSIQPTTRVYMNGSNIIIDNMPYGLIADLDNTGGIGNGIAEINAQIGGISSGRDSIAIYTNGADMTASDVNAAVSGGWPRAEVYYYDYFISVYLQSTSENFAPRISVLQETPAKDLLAQAGYADQAGFVSVSGVTLPFFGAIYYVPDFSFLSGKSLYAYKYEPTVARFVQVEQPYYDGYAAGFLDLNGLDQADGSANGTYVITASPLPDAVTASASEWQSLPTVPQKEERLEIEASGVISADELASSMDSCEELAISDEDGNVTWTFTSIDESCDFDPGAEVTFLSESEILVDFAFSESFPARARWRSHFPRSLKCRTARCSISIIKMMRAEILSSRQTERHQAEKSRLR